MCIFLVMTSGCHWITDLSCCICFFVLHFFAAWSSPVMARFCRLLLGYKSWVQLGCKASLWCRFHGSWFRFPAAALHHGEFRRAGSRGPECNLFCSWGPVCCSTGHVPPPLVSSRWFLRRRNSWKETKIMGTVAASALRWPPHRSISCMASSVVTIQY